MSAQHFIALVNSHIDKDDEQFQSIALQYAARMARNGKKNVAQTVSDLVQKARDSGRFSKPYQGQTPVAMTRPRGEIQEFVVCSDPRLKLSQVVLPDLVAQSLQRVVNQQENRSTLRGFGQTPSSHILLFGPPGTGKTFTATAIAGELRLPLFVVRLETLFSRFLGEAAQKIRQLFDHIAQVRGVYFFDEFDAVGSCRGMSNDVGEVRRILNSILTFMEEPNSTDSLVLAATNHIEILDEALARRFDEIIEYTQPDISTARQILKQQLGKFGFEKHVYTEIDSYLNGLSQGEITRVADSAVKEAILADNSVVCIHTIKSLLENRQTAKQKFRRK